MVPTEVIILLEQVLVEVKNEKECEWKWARGTGHEEETHGWLPFITAKPKLIGTRDTTYRRPNGTRTCGWHPLMTISQDT